MSTGSFSFNASCQPDTLLLFLGADAYQAAYVDTVNRHIQTLQSGPIDLYGAGPIQFWGSDASMAAASLKNVQVIFLSIDWCWTPDDHSMPGTDTWVDTLFPSRIGHNWISDKTGPTQATAWVRVPTPWLTDWAQKGLAVVYKQAAIAGRTPSMNDRYRLDICRLGSICFFSLWDTNRFLYGQPHTITHSDDLLYVLSILLAKYELDAARLDLFLSGEWTIGSEDVNALRARFFPLQTKDCSWSGLGEAYPPHWFTPLEELLRCE